MSWIQQLRDFYRPTTVACDEVGHDPAAQFDPTYLFKTITASPKISLRLICHQEFIKFQDSNIS